MEFQAPKEAEKFKNKCGYNIVGEGANCVGT